MDTELKFAVLIDADNISDKYIKIILEETANEGVATYKRIYGDWTNPALASWKSVLLDNSIIPMQQYSYTTGKNSTDFRHDHRCHGHSLLRHSGRLLHRLPLTASSPAWWPVLRESGMQVIGMGENKTPKPFIAACNQFKYLDILYLQPTEKREKSSPGKSLQSSRFQRKKTVLSPIWISSNKPSPPSWKSFPTKTAGSFPANWAISFPNGFPTLMCVISATPN